MTPSTSFPVVGGCDCKQIRYQLITAPMVVHCCHCRWCQRETGSAFALNAMIESSHVALLAGSCEPEIIATPSESGKGQRIARCPTCRVAVWSNYGGLGDWIRYVRVGTLDEIDGLGPDVHIFTESKQTWVVLGEGVPVFERFYPRAQVFTEKNLRRLEEVRREIEAAKL